MTIIEQTFRPVAYLFSKVKTYSLFLFALNLKCVKNVRQHDKQPEMRIELIQVFNHNYNNKFLTSHSPRSPLEKPLEHRYGFECLDQHLPPARQGSHCAYFQTYPREICRTKRVNRKIPCPNIIQLEIRYKPLQFGRDDNPSSPSLRCILL